MFTIITYKNNIHKCRLLKANFFNARFQGTKTKKLKSSDYMNAVKKVVANIHN